MEALRTEERFFVHIFRATMDRLPRAGSGITQPSYFQNITSLHCPCIARALLVHVHCPCIARVLPMYCPCFTVVLHRKEIKSHRIDITGEVLSFVLPGQGPALV